MRQVGDLAHIISTALLDASYSHACVDKVRLSVCLSVASRSQRVSLIVIPFCLSVCLSVIPRPTAYHDWSITTIFGRQVYTCPQTRVSLFGSPISHTSGARGKDMQNFAYRSCHCCCDGRTVGHASGRCGCCIAAASAALVVEGQPH